MKADEAIREMGKAVLCLHLEIPDENIRDVTKKWNDLVLALVDREKDIREEQQAKDNERCIAILNQARYSGVIDLRSLIARIQDFSWNWKEKEDERTN